MPLGLVLFVLNVAYFGFQLGLLKAPLKYHCTLLLIVCGSKNTKLFHLRLVLLLRLHTLNLRMLLAWLCPQILAVKDLLNTRIEFAISIILIFGFHKLPFTTQRFESLTNCQALNSLSKFELLDMRANKNAPFFKLSIFLEYVIKES